MSTNIYILKLQQDKYYVGKSNDVNKRFQEHKEGNGSLWTQKYPPLSIEKIIKDASNFDEDKHVKEYMDKHGIDNVRGGTYVTETLDENTKAILQKEIWAAKDLCLRCGRNSHFISDCYARSDINGKEIDASKKEIDNSNTKPINIPRKQSRCYRCRRTGHYANMCYARRDVNGKEIDDSDSDDDFVWF